MIVAKVVGTVVSTCKAEGLLSKKILIVRDVLAPADDKPILAIDCVGAGIGETVLVVHEGGSSRIASRLPEGPVDAAVVGIVDYPVGLPFRDE